MLIQEVPEVKKNSNNGIYLNYVYDMIPFNLVHEQQFPYSNWQNWSKIAIVQSKMAFYLQIGKVTTLQNA